MAAQTTLEKTSKDGAFKRNESAFRNWIKEGSDFPPEAGRYHLYVAYGCPWASRCLAGMYLKGLDHIIGLSVVHPTWQKTRPTQDEHAGWTFTSPDDNPVANQMGYGHFSSDGVIPDTVNGAKFIRDLYEMSNDTGGVYSVPVLWDKKRGVIVNNESSEILRMFNAEFNAHAKNPDLDLRPADLAARIDEVNEWVYPNINNGVYRAGFAQKQEPYEQAFGELFAALDKADAILAQQRYICGDRLTEADIRLFHTLIRFDVVYVVYFKCNKKFIHQYDHLREYTKELYQMDGIRKSVNIEHIKMHYFTSHPRLNALAIIPVGPDPWWTQPHNRDSLGKA